MGRHEWTSGARRWRFTALLGVGVAALALIVTLINTLPGKGGHDGKALEGLASQGHGAVSNGDTADFAGFTGGHGMHTMDHMAVHQDAAPAHG